MFIFKGHFPPQNSSSVQTTDVVLEDIVEKKQGLLTDVSRLGLCDFLQIDSGL